VIDALEVRIVPNGIEDPVAAHGCRWSPPPDAVRLCYIGAITEGKGVFVMIDAVKVLLDRGHDVEAVLIGEGNEREVADLRTRIEQYGLQDRVVLAGLMFGREKFEALTNSTLFCFPSFFSSETQPLCVTEAIAVGVPVVATDWRAIPTIVQDGVSGFLVEPGRSDLVADAIETLITSSDMQAFGESGRAHFLSTFTRARFLEDLSAAIAQ
jgi:glycosyltransferase involved in cell wall biosynthesis